MGGTRRPWVEVREGNARSTADSLASREIVVCTRLDVAALQGRFARHRACQSLELGLVHIRTGASAPTVLEHRRCFLATNRKRI
jgi:hypothetical protein